MKDISEISQITKRAFNKKEEEKKETGLMKEVRDLEGLMADAFNESENALFSQRCDTEENMRNEASRNSLAKWQRSQLQSYLVNPNETLRK